MNHFYDTLLAVLREDGRFFTGDGTCLRNAVYEAAMKMDPGLLRLLLGHPEIRARFFTDVDGVLVFDKVGFGWAVNNRAFLPDSYTRYQNRIGLSVDGERPLSATREVALLFPFKDCVLEGGQTKEERGREEIFYHELLSPDQVDRLFHPKALSAAARHTPGGSAPAARLEEGDNLIIKGNNLLALASLLPRYEGQVKCIYIDPPYYFSARREEDTFDYNANFKFSTWLVFMKNRLELARRLLREDGAIFVQISDDGVAELHRLMKEIFGAAHFINKITVRTKSPSGFASVNPGVFETAEYILAFARDKRRWTYLPQYVKSDFDPNYKWYVPNREEAPERWEITDLFEHVAALRGFGSKREAVSALGQRVFQDLAGAFALEHAGAVYRLTAVGDNAGSAVVEAREASRLRRDTVFCVRREGHYDVYLLNGQEMAFYEKKVRVLDGERVPSVQLTNIWTDTPYEGIAREGDVTLKGGKKPEKLLRRILEMSTRPGDLVLDFHAGSGTTCAVAHKLGRRYIGVEQLDHQMDKILARLHGVMAGEKSGISRAVGWQGGGSFVYCELARLNQVFVDEIQAADDAGALQGLYERMMDTGFVSAGVKRGDIQAAAGDFAGLSLGEQKRLLLSLLDKNLLYVNLCDLEDEEFGLTPEDKAFTRAFYEEG